MGATCLRMFEYRILKRINDNNVMKVCDRDTTIYTAVCCTKGMICLLQEGRNKALVVV